MINLLRAVTLACGLLLAAGPANAQFRAKDSLPAMYAIVEICAQKFPAQREQTARALSEWAARNERIVKIVRSSAGFDLDVIHLGRVLTSGPPVDWEAYCARLPSEMGKAESDPREIDFRVDETEIPPGFEVQLAHETKRLCDARHPEMKAASDAALSDWTARNRKIIDRERGAQSYGRASAAVRKVLEAQARQADDVKRVCAEFPGMLKLGPFDPL